MILIMKKNIGLCVVFVFALAFFSLFIALLVELFLITETIHRQFQLNSFFAIALYLLPLSLLFAIFTSYIYAMKKNIPTVQAVFITFLLLACVTTACAFFPLPTVPEINSLFQYIPSHNTDSTALLQNVVAYLLPVILRWNTLLHEVSVFSILFSVSFLMMILSYYAVTFRCTTWKIANCTFMITMTIVSFFLFHLFVKLDIFSYPSFSFLRQLQPYQEIVFFFTVAVLCFLFLLLRTIRSKKSAHI